jgi:hypothetical protein
MHTVWAQRREAVLRDCLVSPDVFTEMVDRLDEFIVPYQHVLDTKVGQRNVPLYRLLPTGTRENRLLMAYCPP